MYITYSEYTDLYGAISEDVFTRLAFDACRVIDYCTKGIDNVKKLKVAFPTDEDDAATVKYCAAKLVNILHQIEDVEAYARSGRGYTETANGLQGKVISSVTAGNESISFFTGSTEKTAIDAAAADGSVKSKLLRDTVREYLAGVTDANGVNLLYMGRYPYPV